MKKLLATAAVAATVLSGSVAAATSASAALPAATRVVIYAGVANRTGGPVKQSRTTWTISASPNEIYTDNDCFLIENTTPANGAGNESEWHYRPQSLAVVLQKFTWAMPIGGGQHVGVSATNLESAGKWAYLGNGTYTPLCMTWTVGGGKIHEYITVHEYTANVFTWTKIASASKCATSVHSA
jgi:hypothetical protein